MKRVLAILSLVLLPALGQACGYGIQSSVSLFAQPCYAPAVVAVPTVSYQAVAVPCVQQQVEVAAPVCPSVSFAAPAYSSFAAPYSLGFNSLGYSSFGAFDSFGYGNVGFGRVRGFNSVSVAASGVNVNVFAGRTRGRLFGGRRGTTIRTRTVTRVR